MRWLGSAGLLATLTVFFVGAAQEKKPPEKLVFSAKVGNVTFPHAKHAEREKGDCKVCHNALWPQDSKAPLNYKASLHKAAEAKKTSCAACHVSGGKSFVSTGNCAKCHQRPATKS